MSRIGHYTGLHTRSPLDARRGQYVTGRARFYLRRNEIVLTRTMFEIIAEFTTLNPTFLHRLSDRLSRNAGELGKPGLRYTLAHVN